MPPEVAGRSLVKTQGQKLMPVWQHCSTTSSGSSRAAVGWAGWATTITDQLSAPLPGLGRRRKAAALLPTWELRCFVFLFPGTWSELNFDGPPVELDAVEQAHSVGDGFLVLEVDEGELLLLAIPVLGDFNLNHRPCLRIKTRETLSGSGATPQTLKKK